ncbi:MAG: hypothetical protein M3343_10080 [Actinomycetota bacterium]|nr:hypothetical protein [Actinomycetota bacterium]
MVANEAAREELRRSLERVLGPAETATLMGVLPPEQPETRFDLEAHRAEARSDLEAHRAEAKSDLEALGATLKSDLESLEGRMDARFEQVDARFGQIDEKIDHRFEVFEYKFIAALHQEIGMVRTDFSKQLIGQTKAFIFATTSTLIALAALGVAALRLA